MTAATFFVKTVYVAGHIQGAPYSVDIRAVECSPSRKREGVQSVSLNGNTQTVINRNDRYWAVTTEHYDSSTTAYAALMELMDSIDEGEKFYFDAEGYVSAPDDMRPAMLSGNYRRVRVEQTGDFYFTFEVRILP